MLEMGKFRNTFLIGLAALLLSLPCASSAQERAQCKHDPKYLEELLNARNRTEILSPFPVSNPYKPLNDSTTIFYGSGDANNDGSIDWVDYDLITSKAVSNDQTDIDGDGIASTSSDLNILENYLNKNINYLPSDWLSLETGETARQRRINWLEKMIIIDKTDTLPYIIGAWVCQDFAILTQINFFGYERKEDEQSSAHSLYDTLSTPVRFNIPVYHVGVVTSEWGHRINVTLVGNDARKFCDWYFFEPQTDEKAKIGDWNMPKNCGVYVFATYWKNPQGWDQHYPVILVEWNIQDSIPNLTYYDPDLILNREDLTDVEENIKQIPLCFSLKQNYPNPFNSKTTIEYTLQKPSNVLLNVYNIRGQKVKTLVNKIQELGNYSIDYNASGLASGVYFYELKTNVQNESKRMIFIK